MTSAIYALELALVVGVIALCAGLKRRREAPSGKDKLVIVAVLGALLAAWLKGYG